jgi:hypothetical protein
VRRWSATSHRARWLARRLAGLDAREQRARAGFQARALVLEVLQRVDALCRRARSTSRFDFAWRCSFSLRSRLAKLAARSRTVVSARARSSIASATRRSLEACSRRAALRAVAAFVETRAPRARRALLQSGARLLEVLEQVLRAGALVQLPSTDSFLRFATRAQLA